MTVLVIVVAVVLLAALLAVGARHREPPADDAAHPVWKVDLQRHSVRIPRPL